MSLIDYPQHGEVHQVCDLGDSNGIFGDVKCRSYSLSMGEKLVGVLYKTNKSKSVIDFQFIIGRMMTGKSI